MFLDGTGRPGQVRPRGAASADRRLPRLLAAPHRRLGAAGRRRAGATSPTSTSREHVREVRLPAPGDAAALQAYVGSFLATPLPRDRPLWDIHLVEGLDEGSAIYVRLHHALADGIALTQVLLSLTDATADADDDGVGRRRGAAPRRRRPHRSRPARRPRGDEALRPARVRAATAAAIRTGLSGAGVLSKLLLTRNPQSALAGAGGHAQAGGLVRPDRPAADQGHRQGPRTPPSTTSWSRRSPAPSSATRSSTAAARSTSRRWSRSTCARCTCRLPRELGNRFALVVLLLPSGLHHRRRAARRDQAPDGPDQALPGAGHHVRDDPGDRPAGPAAEQRPRDLLRRQGQRCHHQRPRPAGAALPGGDADHQPAGLGARIRRTRRSAPASSPTPGRCGSASRPTPRSSRTRSTSSTPSTRRSTTSAGGWR